MADRTINNIDALVEFAAMIIFEFAGLIITMVAFLCFVVVLPFAMLFDIIDLIRRKK